MNTNTNQKKTISNYPYTVLGQTNTNLFISYTFPPSETSYTITTTPLSSTFTTSNPYYNLPNLSASTTYTINVLSNNNLQSNFKAMTLSNYVSIDLCSCITSSSGVPQNGTTYGSVSFLPGPAYHLGGVFDCSLALLNSNGTFFYADMSYSNPNKYYSNINSGNNIISNTNGMWLGSSIGTTGTSYNYAQPNTSSSTSLRTFAILPNLWNFFSSTTSGTYYIKYQVINATATGAAGRFWPLHFWGFGTPPLSGNSLNYNLQVQGITPTLSYSITNNISGTAISGNATASIYFSLYSISNLFLSFDSVNCYIYIYNNSGTNLTTSSVITVPFTANFNLNTIQFFKYVIGMASQSANNASPINILYVNTFNQILTTAQMISFSNNNTNPFL